MKIQIRHSVFETNSSSTHALCLGKFVDYNNIPKEITFGVDDGTNYWTGDKSTMQYRINSLYSVILNSYCTSDALIFMGKIQKALDGIGVTVHFNFDKEYINNNSYTPIDFDKIEDSFDDPETVIRYLFSDGSGIYCEDRDDVYNHGGWASYYHIDTEKVQLITF